eukprot:TRINITY_DN9109_c0_g1_i1.p1 TRINITY_DN9109_c0_g1~~TRINITY_DN9109_c0_g1_i1.p1  ORF type:complete len:515 (-),score=142.41 TRINITY_DN9109_c0_g1_i1:644-2188(-)
MMRTLAIAALAAALLSSVALSLEEIRFNRPKILAEAFPDGVYNRPALFGIPPYGATITGRLIYATPGDRDACTELNTSLVENWPGPDEQFIVMVNRGECTFVTKVKHAQDVGARAVIVVDNQDASDVPFMADDGKGKNVQVPSMIIRKSDGDTIKEALSDGTIVVVTMRWRLPNPDGVVDWSLWTSSYDSTASELKSSFEDVMASMGDSVRFTPHYFFLDGLLYGCDQEQGTACGNQCVGSGKYCAVDPEHNLTGGISGADVVRENLRQVCVWRNVNSTGNPMLWWRYVNQFQRECANANDFNFDCSQRVMKSLGINIDIISQCVEASGGYADQSTQRNSLIDKELDARREMGVYLLPTMIAENVPFQGSMNCPTPVSLTECDALNFICSGYPQGGAPDACHSADGCPLHQSRDACGNCVAKDSPDRKTDSSQCTSENMSTGVSAGGVVGIVFLMTTIVALGFFYLHRRSQASMRRELADIMAQYVPLGNEEREDMQSVPSFVDSSAPRKNSFH